MSLHENNSDDEWNNKSGSGSESPLFQTSTENLNIIVEHFSKRINNETQRASTATTRRASQVTFQDDKIPHFRHNETVEKTIPEELNAKFSIDNPFFDIDQNFPEISAMSLASLYQSGDNLDCDMNTDKDVLEFYSTNVPQISLPDRGDQTDSQEPSVLPPVDQTRQEYSYNLLDQVKNVNVDNCLNDGISSIDFVLVWDSTSLAMTSPVAFLRRQTFERNIMKEGLRLENDSLGTDVLHFVKIHVPREVLRRYSEILKLRMPMKEEICKQAGNFEVVDYYTYIGVCFLFKIPSLAKLQTRVNFIIERITNQWEKLKEIIFVDQEKFPKKKQRFTALYRRDREYLFDVTSPNFFTPAIRSRIVQFILDRKRFDDDPSDAFAFGMERLINEKVYAAAYPLHDGDLREPGSTRNLLFMEWASLRKWYRYQPLDYVKEYFGVKIGLYFAWLGYYTHMLIPAAVVGLTCFIISCITLYENEPSEDICNGVLKTKMCPVCDKWCSYWDIKETCLHSRFTYLFDNGSTILFAVFMTFWATLFLEMWKRYSAEINHRWDLTGFDKQEEHPRPQYLARLANAKRKHLNVITNTMEPIVPFWSLRVPITIFSFSVVMLLIALAIATVVSVVLYRTSIMVVLSVYQDRVGTSSAMLFTTTTAACINLCCILFFNWMYKGVAEYLTEMELLRTQSQFDDSLTLKIYLLQFVNYYSSIFYIAFFKGKFVGTPKEYNTFFTYRQEECGPGGCLLELSIQLAIIMVGKQALNTVLEMLWPVLYKWMNYMKIKAGLAKIQASSKGGNPQWVKDYRLVDWGPRSLFHEYLEMVLQYGFVTIFVAAFPLAPFFALLNNILEMRLDARKLLTFYRRPVAQRVKNIGVWYRILDSISKLSVITNGLIIAFTSDFIPRFVYQTTVSPDFSLKGYLNYSLSYFKTADFLNGSQSGMLSNETYCRYPDYRQPPWSKMPYEHSGTFWTILAARLTFVLVFENVVALVMIIVRWLIPDIPRELKDRIKRENYITNEIIIHQESMRACAGYVYTEPRVTKEQIKNMTECPATPEQWDRLIGKSLSSSHYTLSAKDGQPPDEDGPKSPTSV